MNSEKKDERKPIDSQTIYNNLKWGIKADIVVQIINFFVFLFIHAMILTVFLIMRYFDIKMLFIPIALWVIFLYPIAYFINNAIRISKERKVIINREYSIVSDRLTKICPGESEPLVFLRDTFFRHRRNYITVTAYYYEKYGRSTLNGGYSEYSVEGEEYYLVVRNTDGEILSVYSQRFYAFND